MKKITSIIIMFLLYGYLPAACNSGDGDNGTGSDTDTDADTDTDTDADTNTDTSEIPGEWVTIPAGSFWMGSPDGNCPSDYPGGADCAAELGRFTDEDLHYVKLTRSFEIQTSEVTQRQYEDVTKWNPSLFAPTSSIFACGLDCPVERVSWYDALAYSNELSIIAGFTTCYVLTNIICSDGTNVGTDALGCMDEHQHSINSATITLNGVSSVYDCEGYRLPTESEREYAIRAGSITALYPSEGNDGSLTTLENDPNMDQIGWVDPGALKRTHPIGEKEANAWGLCDMPGNVVEWTWDLYVASYPSGDTQNPVIDPEGPPSDGIGEQALPGERVMRGGHWILSAGFSRSARRLFNSPGGDLPIVGFRPVRTIL